MKDDRKGYIQNNELFLFAGLFFLALHLYIELEGFFAGFGWSHPLVNQKLAAMINPPGAANRHWLFTDSHWVLKTGGGLCIILFSLGGHSIKSVKMTRKRVLTAIGLGLLLFFGTLPMLTSTTLLAVLGVPTLSMVYIAMSFAGLLYLIKGVQNSNRLLGFVPGSDEFNEENESFPQQETRIDNEFSVNIQIVFVYKKKLRQGWINLTNTFRSLLIMGTPGSGKSYGAINSVIRQHIEKGCTMYIYDWKFPDLSLVAFNAMRRHQKKLPKNTKFYCINFDDPSRSHRCNPVDPIYIQSIDDAYETSKLMMCNINRTWIGKEGDFWADSAINYATAVLWYLRCYDKGQYCTFPHLVEMMTIDYRKIFPLLMEREDLEAYMVLFISAYTGGAMEQLEGQMGSARSGLAKLSSPGVYWAMSANDFTLDINNEKAPKILCIGNNNKKKNLYAAALSLYNARVLNQINVPHQLPSSVVIDELPTIYFQGLDNLIATGRGHRISTTIAMQDFSQLEKDYGKSEAEAIRNTVGSVISGAVKGNTAKAIEDMLGKNVQRKQSVTIQSEDTTHSITTDLQPMMPAAKVARMDAGVFAGIVAGGYGQESELKAFHGKIIIDDADFKAEQKYKKLPEFSIFAQEKGSVSKQVAENYKRIKRETKDLVATEIARLEKDSKLPPVKTQKKNGRRN